MSTNTQVIYQKLDPNAPVEQQNAALTKTVRNLIGRIERQVLSAAYSVPHPTLVKELDGLVARVKNGDYYITSAASRGRLVDWDLFESALVAVLSQGDPAYVFPPNVIEELDAERNFQECEEKRNVSKERLRSVQSRNGQPVVPGRWRKEAYGKRCYNKLTDYAINASVGQDEAAELRLQLQTPLNGFLGQAYNYDDHSLTEEWMMSFRDAKIEDVSAEDVRRTQVASLLELMGVQVQDRVCNENGVLQREPVGLDSGMLKEVPVWGIDCYTHRMIEIAIEDRVAKELFCQKTVRRFIDRRILPAINAQPPDVAHNMGVVANYIIQCADENPSKVIDKIYAAALADAVNFFGIDSFRIHPKGTGVVCTAPEGIPPHVLISEYLGTDKTPPPI